jgi:hypothetical protein
MEFQYTRVFVQVGATLRVGWPVNGKARTHTPPQMKQALHMVGVKMRQNNGIQITWGKPFMKICQSGIQQDARVT